MRVLLSTIGSRGDVQPLVALASELTTLGLEVRLCVPPDFREWIESLGMTHGFLDDLEMLTRLAPFSLTYIGVLGPRDRTRRLEQALASEGIHISDQGAHAPAGLDIGAETPEEIALAIAAEIQACLTGARGGFLKNGSGPIHPLSRVVDHADVTGVAVDARVDKETFVR